MAEKETKNPNLEKLLQMGTIEKIANAINESKTPTQLYAHNFDLLKILGNGLTDDEVKGLYGDIRNSPQEAIRYANDKIGLLQDEVQDWYKENKDSVVKETASKINENLKKVDSKAKAANMLVAYFDDLLSIPDMTQRDADEMAQKELAKKLGARWNYSATGNIDQVKALKKRIAVSPYVKEVKNEEGKVSYSIDEAKLAETMNDIGPAAMLYTNAMNIKFKEASKEE
ncbi:MAG: hypothetical protein PHF86_03980 [Candidatus Nanoarchaeia archaeon]|nr:hypothetical protein [Candidatus Nanoarchaeia archaeon]